MKILTTSVAPFAIFRRPLHGMASRRAARRPTCAEATQRRDDDPAPAKLPPRDKAPTQRSTGLAVPVRLGTRMALGGAAWAAVQGLLATLPGYCCWGPAFWADVETLGQTVGPAAAAFLALNYAQRHTARGGDKSPGDDSSK